MPKKEWTAEERKAFGEKMRKAKLDKETHSTYPPTPPTPPEPVDPGPVQNQEVEELKRMIQEMQASMWQQSQGRQVNQLGATIGTTERYSLDPDNYPDPRERLAKEQRLSRFAFDQNFELNYLCHPTRRYQTIDGHWQIEPQFDLELIRIVMDEVTGEPTNGRYVVCRGIFFEDPDSAISVARENGLEVDENNEKSFLDEMRYLRMRDWLLEAFYPPLPQVKQNKKEMVIGGKLVEYFEVNSENSEAIPFSKLRTKV